MRWPCSIYSGACSNLLPLKKSGFSVKNVALGTTSSVHGPHALEMPSSGLNDQRLLPRLSNLVSSYCPRGADTCKLIPTMRSCLYFANSFQDSAGAPSRFTETRNRGSPNPDIPRSLGWFSTMPCAEKSEYGTITSNLADCRPKWKNSE